jgi:hypothetical protein
LLYEDETILWRFALPRLGWWRRAQRPRLPIRPLSQGQIKREESLKRQTWLQYRSWSRITSGVLLSVMGALQYGTSKVGFDHGVGHPLLLLYDAKTPHGQKIKEFKGLGHDPLNTSISLI